MQYLLNITKNDYFENLRPSIEGLDNRIVERDTMDDVVMYLVSILDNDEQKKLAEIYWSYVTDFQMLLCKTDNTQKLTGMRYGVIEFIVDEKSSWGIIISEYNQTLKDNYKEPNIRYMEIDE